MPEIKHLARAFYNQILEKPPKKDSAAMR